ncbi:MAG: universal stress protein [Candidatus Obscuribacterales bacterium]|jgi:nucleotide-binding universal stress UspA family protein|nr:universal stress protein [Candidatus Obscuribacterales bacterium]
MKVLVAIEDEQSSDKILDFVFRHRWSAQTEFLVVKVIEPLMVGHAHSVLPSPVVLEMMEDARKVAASAVRHVALRFRDQYHSNNIQEIVEEGFPAQNIVDIAVSEKVDLIIMGTHARRGAERFVLGSVSHWVAAHAPCEVLIIHPRKSIKPENPAHPNELALNAS